MQSGFSIQKTYGALGRAGEIQTPHGSITTPAFIVVGTKASVKGLSSGVLAHIGVPAVLANTYHLFLQPGEGLVHEAGGLHAFMNWDGPIVTDSGGFQVFSLGAAYGSSVTKIAHGDGDASPRTPAVYDEDLHTQHGKLAIVDEEGVTFTSHLDGTLYRFTPERSIEIQHALGADIIFAFDECTSPHASVAYQREALDRTHRWARQSLTAHRQNVDAARKQMLYGVVQGGRVEELRRESARVLADMDFDGYGIGGSFDKHDIHAAVRWVNEELPKEKPRHLLGIGEPEDFFGAIENGVDTFDCVAPTRLGRTGSAYTYTGKINMRGSEYRRDFAPIDKQCECRVCQNYSRAYIAHLFHAKEMLGAVLLSEHNVYFITHLVARIRQAILDGQFETFRDDFLGKYR